MLKPKTIVSPNSRDDHAVKQRMIAGAFATVTKWRSAETREQRAFYAASLYGSIFPWNDVRTPSKLEMSDQEWDQLWGEMAEVDLLEFQDVTKNFSDRSGAAIRLLDCIRFGLPVRIPQLTSVVVQKMQELANEWEAHKP